MRADPSIWRPSLRDDRMREQADHMGQQMPNAEWLLKERSNCRAPTPYFLFGEGAEHQNWNLL